MGVARSIAGVQLFAELFQGATTTVYKGYERSLDRFVLLKVLQPEFAADEVLARRFEEEARLAAKIQHPNVVAIYSFGHEDDDIYFTAEFVEGFTLRQIIDTGKLPPELAAFIILQVASGLQAAHERTILHRDIKPENVLVSHDGQVKLSDFGMASFASSVSEDADIRGTLGYFSPEQVLGERLGKASDLFSLGVTFYELLARRPAFVGDGLAQTFDAVLHYNPLPYLGAGGRVPDALVHICTKLLAKNPEQRYADAGALIADLKAFVAPLDGAASQEALHQFLQAPDDYVAASLLTDVPVEMVSGDGAALQVAAPPPSVPARRKLNARWITTMGFGVAILAIAIFAVYAGALRSGGRVGTTLGPVDTALQLDRPGPYRTSRDAYSGAALLERQVVIDSIRASIGIGYSSAENAGSGKHADDPSASAAPEHEGASGMVRVDCNPWCSAFIDGTGIGDSPILTPVPVRPGAHEVMLSHPGYPDIRIDIKVEPGETKKLSILLDDYVGEVRVAVSPWAYVLVDGVLRDTVPPGKPLYLLPGRHALALRHDALGTYETVIDVEAGTKTIYTYQLDELLKK
ncbi:MAG TPA: serine/threonine-protein kinase [Rhodothermales bacterium]|nr:serine/threonine-protein kinase [Rhodothermales bacterium]